jgi:hypothetical protein
MKKQAPLLILTVILFLIANVGFWLARTIYNPQNFTNLVVQTYRQEDVRNAISSEIVDKTLESKPLVNQVIGQPVQGAISGILGSPTFQSVLEKVATKFQAYLTTDNRQDVTLQIGQVSTFVKAAATAVSPQLGDQVPDVTPQTITLVKANSLPNINRWAKPIMTLGPLAGVIGIGILIYLFYTEEDRVRLLRRTSTYFLIGIVVFGLLIPYFRTILQGNVGNQNAEIIATATYDAFTKILTSQLIIFASIFFITYFVGYFLMIRKSEVLAGNDKTDKKEKNNK